ncbi:MAG: PAS domain S-box protein [Rhodospirillales bacterium]|nr:PAS domain S-box protein [Rhodospirillales bacterium]
MFRQPIRRRDHKALAEERIKRLTKLSELSMTLSGDPVEVFQRVAQMIGELLDVPVVCLSEIRGDELHFLSVYLRGEVFANAGHCPLGITPCATVRQSKEIRVYDRVAERFPEATFLKQHNAFAYCGFPSLGNDGEVVAVTCLLDDQPHDFGVEDQELLRIFGQRIGLEVERQRHQFAQERMAKALGESEAWLRGILDTSPEAIIAIDEAHRICLFNQGAEAVFGLAAEEMLGQPLDRLLPPRFRDGHRGLIEEFARSPEASRLNKHRGEVAGLRKDGGEFPAEASISKLRLADRTIFTVVLRDITKRRNVEAQLCQAQKMEALGQLTGGVAHDFNNLLAIIMSNAELLEQRLGESDQAARAVLRAANRGAALVQRLLAFARRQPLHPQAVDPKSLVSSMSEMLDRILVGSIEVRTLAAADLWYAMADPAQLENALLNLAINARDAMPQGGGLTIEITHASLQTEEAAQLGIGPGDYVVLAVEDTGSGIPPEILDRVVEPFFTTKEVGEGSGLGLSMVYGFAEQSGGHVTIQSALGEGTTVKLYLPRARRADLPAWEIEDDPTPVARDETILVVEDDPEVRALTVSMLDELGYSVLEAEDGKTALPILLGPVQIDLLLADVVLPGGLSGPDVAVAAKRREPDIEVMFMSGYTDAAKAGRGVLECEIELLDKPFRRRDLAQKVRASLDRRLADSSGRAR